MQRHALHHPHARPALGAHKAGRAVLGNITNAVGRNNNNNTNSAAIHRRSALSFAHPAAPRLAPTTAAADLAVAAEASPPPRLPRRPRSVTFSADPPAITVISPQGAQTSTRLYRAALRQKGRAAADAVRQRLAELGLDAGGIATRAERRRRQQQEQEQQEQEQEEQEEQEQEYLEQQEQDPQPQQPEQEQQLQHQQQQQKHQHDHHRHHQLLQTHARVAAPPDKATAAITMGTASSAAVAASGSSPLRKHTTHNAHGDSGVVHKPASGLQSLPVQFVESGTPPDGHHPRPKATRPDKQNTAASHTTGASPTPSWLPPLSGSSFRAARLSLPPTSAATRLAEETLVVPPHQQKMLLPAVTTQPLTSTPPEPQSKAPRLRVQQAPFQRPKSAPPASAIKLPPASLSPSPSPPPDVGKAFNLTNLPALMAEANLKPEDTLLCDTLRQALADDRRPRRRRPTTTPAATDCHRIGSGFVTHVVRPEVTATGMDAEPQAGQLGTSAAVSVSTAADAIDLDWLPAQEQLRAAHGRGAMGSHVVVARRSTPQCVLTAEEDEE